MKKPRTVGFLGVGLLGSALAERLPRTEYHLIAHDPDPGRAVALAELGLRWVPDPAGVLDAADVLVSAVPDGPTLLDLIEGIQPGAVRPGRFWIDCTTCSPEEASAAARRATSLGIEFLEAPISGGSQHVRAGVALMLVSGREECFRGVQEFLRLLCPAVLYVGPSGSAATLKLVTNLVLGLNRLALAEGLGLAAAAGIDGATTLEALRRGAARSAVMDAKGDRMVRRDYDPPDARLRQHLKDVELILDLAEAHGMRLPASELHRELLRRAVERGLGDMDNAAVRELFTTQPVG